MPNKIQFKRGQKVNIPTLNVGEPALCTDTNEVFVGNTGGNIELVNKEIFYATFKSTTASKISFPAHKKYRAWQGVSTDGKYIYITSDRDEDFNLKNIISVYSMNGELVTEKLDAYTGTDPQGKFMSFGDCTVIDGKLFVTVYNVNGGGNPLISRIVEYSLPNLVLLKTTDIGAGIAECIVKYDNAFWVSYENVQEIKKFSTNYTLLATYSLSKPRGADGGYQGIVWLDGDLYLNVHGPNELGKTPTGALHRYSFNGINFVYVENIEPPTYGTTQGLAYHNGFFYWNDRPNNEIVITNSIKGGKIKPLLNRISNNQIFKPILTNGWQPYDTNYDRTLKVWKDYVGIVHLEGMVKGGAIPSVICKLPEGYRPQYSRNFVVDSGGGFGRIAIVGNNSSSGSSGAGEVHIAVGANEYVCLDGITFLSDPEV